MMYLKTAAERLMQEVLKMNEMNDIEFITHIIAEIANYARENNYDVDETIERMSVNLHDILSITTFENWGENE